MHRSLFKQSLAFPNRALRHLFFSTDAKATSKQLSDVLRGKLQEYTEHALTPAKKLSLEAFRKGSVLFNESRPIQMYHKITGYDKILMLHDEERKKLEDFTTAVNEKKEIQERKHSLEEERDKLTREINLLSARVQNGDNSGSAELKEKRSRCDFLNNKDTGVDKVRKELESKEKECDDLKILHAKAVANYFQEYRLYSDRLQWLIPVGYLFLFVVYLISATFQYRHKKSTDKKLSAITTAVAAKDASEKETVSPTSEEAIEQIRDLKDRFSAQLGEIKAALTEQNALVPIVSNSSSSSSSSSSNNDKIALALAGGVVMGIILTSRKS